MTCKSFHIEHHILLSFGKQYVFLLEEQRNQYADLKDQQHNINNLF